MNGCASKVGWLSETVEIDRIAAFSKTSNTEVAEIAVIARDRAESP